MFVFQMHESAVLETHVRDHVISGLDEDASYNVTVTAITSAGELSSKAVLATTHEDGIVLLPLTAKTKTL